MSWQTLCHGVDGQGDYPHECDGGEQTGGGTVCAGAGEIRVGDYVWPVRDYVWPVRDHVWPVRDHEFTGTQTDGRTPTNSGALSSPSLLENLIRS